MVKPYKISPHEQRIKESAMKKYWVPESSEVTVEGEERRSNIHHLSHDLFYLTQPCYLLSVEAVVDDASGSFGSSITVEPSSPDPHFFKNYLSRSNQEETNPGTELYARMNHRHL